jgi:hypothetical protein
MTAPDRPDLDALEQIANGWRGRFAFDGEREDLIFINADCDAKECDCEVKLNSDGDQDCSVEVDDIDDAGPDVATMLNALPALVAEVRRLEQRQQELLQTIRNLSATVPYPEEQRTASVLIAEVGTLRSELAAERDAHHATCDALARERAEVERLRGLIIGTAKLLRDRNVPHTDHACDECVPGGPIVIPGFVCLVHAIRKEAAGE